MHVCTAYREIAYVVNLNVREIACVVNFECTQVEFGNLFPQTFTFNDVLSRCALYCVNVGERNKV